MTIIASLDRNSDDPVLLFTASDGMDMYYIEGREPNLPYPYGVNDVYSKLDNIDYQLNITTDMIRILSEPELYDRDAVVRTEAQLQSEYIAALSCYAGQKGYDLYEIHAAMIDGAYYSLRAERGWAQGMNLPLYTDETISVDSTYAAVTGNKGYFIRVLEAV